MLLLPVLPLLLLQLRDSTELWRRRLLSKFQALVDELIKLCHWQPPQQRIPKSTAKSPTDFPTLVRLLPVEVSPLGCLHIVKSP